MQDILKAVGKWLALVVVLVAVLLGAALGFMYTQVNVGDLPAYAVTFGGGELPQTGYQWKVPIAGNWLARTLSEEGEAAGTSPSSSAAQKNRSRLLGVPCL